MLSKTRAALAAAFTLALLNGCGNEDANSGQVRLVNATAEFTTMDLYDVDSGGSSNRLISGTASNTASGYASLTRGTYTFNLVGAGSSAPSSTTAATDITKQDHFAVIAFLTGGALQNVVVPEEEPAPSSGNAKLRILNGASAEAGAVDVFVTANNCTALTDIDTAFATSVSGLQTAFSQLITSPSGSTWNLCVTGTGDKTDLRLAVPGVTFTNQEVATLILTRTPSGVLLNGMLLTQQGTLAAYPNTFARVRLVSDAAAAGTVSATLDGTSVAVEQGSPYIGMYQAIPSGAMTLSLSIDGQSIAAPSLSATAGSDFTLLVAGTVASPMVALLPDSNLPSTNVSTPVRMRLVNGLNNLSSPASLTANGKSVASGIAFGTASSYTSIAEDTTGTAPVTAFASTTPPFSFTFTPILLSSGGVYTAFLLGDIAPPISSAAGSDLRLDRTAIPVTPPASSASSSS